MPRPVQALALLALPALLACGASAPSGAPAKAAKSDPAAIALPAPPAPVTSLKRADVKKTIAQGLGVFLQNVALDDYPVMQNGKFHGFKLRELNPDWLVDLRPGDVIVRVNGVVPEHPDEADAALRSLEKARSLKVDYERDGKPGTLELPIVE